VDLKPGSLAVEDGLRAGDQVLMVEGVTPSRATLWQIMYAFHAVRHRRELRMRLQSPDGARREAVIRARVTPPRQFQRFEDWIDALALKLETRNSAPIRTALVGADGVVVQLTSFNLDDGDIDRTMDRVRGKRALILDLRENPGGRVDALRRVAGYFFEKPTAIAELRGRKKTDAIESAHRPADRVFHGKVVVLVDSASGSAAEVLARVLQLTRRATVIGDRSSGAVMVSRPHIYTDGNEARFLMYGLGITEATLLMADGASLERTGVVPDEPLLPSPEDLAAGLDPVLARAAALLNLPLDPKAAGVLFPRDWR
jgi:C-terminal processing protease CtpA/Prc